MADTEPDRCSTSGATPKSSLASPSGEPQNPLPKLSPAEFRIYNRLAEHMDYFHTHFRQTWTMLQTACETKSRPHGMSIKQFLSVGEDFVHQLNVHHNIEEVHIFPVLAKRMPAFRKELELLSQHKEIHAGLEKLEEYLRECRAGERELRLGELKGVLDGFGGVLWEHLDDEVRELRAENMRRYWSVQEMRSMPM